MSMSLQVMILCDVDDVNSWEQANGDDPTLDKIKGEMSGASSLDQLSDLEAQAETEEDNVSTYSAPISEQISLGIEDIAVWEQANGDDPVLDGIEQKISQVNPDGGLQELTYVIGLNNAALAEENRQQGVNHFQV